MAFSSVDLWSSLFKKKIDVWKSGKLGRERAQPSWPSLWTPWRRLSCVTKVNISCWTSFFLFFCSLPVKGEPIRLHLQELKFKAKTYFCRIQIDRTTTRGLAEEIFAHFKTDTTITWGLTIEIFANFEMDITTTRGLTMEIFANFKMDITTTRGLTVETLGHFKMDTTTTRGPTVEIYLQILKWIQLAHESWQWK